MNFRGMRRGLEWLLLTTLIIPLTIACASSKEEKKKETYNPPYEYIEVKSGETDYAGEIHFTDNSTLEDITLDVVNSNVSPFFLSFNILILMLILQMAKVMKFFG